MTTCQKCGTSNDESGLFCENCGTALARPDAARQAPPSLHSSPMPEEVGVLTKLERSIHFRFARFAGWMLLIIAIIGFVFGLVSAIPSGLKALGDSEQDVTVQDVSAAVAALRSGQGGGARPGAASTGELDAEGLANLDRAIYDVIGLVPPSALEQQGGVDQVRGNLKRLLGNLTPESKNESGDTISFQTRLLKDMKGTIEDMPSADRFDAIWAYGQVRSEKLQAASAEKAKAAKEFTISGGSALVAGFFIIQISIILVLLAIERAIRQSVGGRP